MSCFPKRFDGSKVGTVLGAKANVTKAGARDAGEPPAADAVNTIKPAALTVTSAAASPSDSST